MLFQVGISIPISYIHSTIEVVKILKIGLQVSGFWRWMWKIYSFWIYFPPNDSSSLEVRTTKIQLAAIYKEEKWYFQKTIFMLENCHEWVFLPEWFLLIYQTNKSISCPMYSIKVTFLLRKRAFPKNSCWQKSPTDIYPLEPSGTFYYCTESFPFLTEAIWLDYRDSCCIPTTSL